jgi:hypothetical protein
LGNSREPGLILQTRAAKVILSILAMVLLGCAVFIAITGWDSESTTEVTMSVTETTLPTEPTLDSTPVSLVEETPMASNAQSVPIAGVYVEPFSMEAGRGQEISVDVMANLSNSGISDCEFTLEFDPSVLQVNDLVAGDLLGADPLVGSESKDNQSGFVRFAIARKGLTQATDSIGVLARIKFHIVNSAASGPVSLIPSDVKLTNERFDEIPGLQIQSGSIYVAP